MSMAMEELKVIKMEKITFNNEQLEFLKFIVQDFEYNDFCSAVNPLPFGSMIVISVR